MSDVSSELPFLAEQLVLVPSEYNAASAGDPLSIVIGMSRSLSDERTRRSNVIDVPEIILQPPQQVHKGLHLAPIEEALQELKRVAQFLQRNG
jgi:hypothetical protein